MHALNKISKQSRVITSKVSSILLGKEVLQAESIFERFKFQTPIERLLSSLHAKHQCSNAFYASSNFPNFST